MVDTGDNRRCVQRAHDQGAETERDGDQRLNAADNAGLYHIEHRSDDRHGEEAGDKDRNQRGDKQIKHRRNVLVQELFDLRHHKDRDDDRDDMSLITDKRNLPQTEHVEILFDAAGHRPCVLQIRMYHNHADDAAEERIGAEYLRTGETDQNRKEYIRGVGEHIRQYKQRTVGGQIQISAVDHKVQRLHDAHQETGGDNRRDDRNKDVAERLDKPLERISLLRRGRLDLVLAHRLNARLLDKLLVHLVDHAGAEDDLQLTGCLKHALRAVDILQLRLAYLAVVRDDQTQSRRTVRRGYNVFFSADVFDDFGGGCFVIHHFSLHNRLLCETYDEIISPFYLKRFILCYRLYTDFPGFSIHTFPNKPVVFLCITHITTQNQHHLSLIASDFYYEKCFIS